MTYDNELTLIKQTVTQDANGNNVSVETMTDILCGIKSIGRSEFYAAASAGLRPKFVFVVHAYEYQDEQLVEYEGERYKVLRTYGTGFEEMEIIVERTVGEGVG